MSVQLMCPQGSLSVLDVSGNHVKDLYSIGALVFLEQLNLSENDIEDLQVMRTCLRTVHVMVIHY